MSSFPVGVVVAQERIEVAERHSRQLADACYAAWTLANVASGSPSRTANVIMDCSYIASATARLLSHHDEHHRRAVAMQVAVARRLARHIAQVCWQHPSPALLACAGAARQAIESYDELLKLLAEALRARRSIDSDIAIVLPDADESVA